MHREVLILGGGMTGLAAGLASRWPVFEAEAKAGGICSSYYVRPNSSEKLNRADEHSDAYRFEIGGGHWIFGGDPVLTRFMHSLTPMKSYSRLSSVYFPDWDLYVPYPLQNHLSYLPKGIRLAALKEMLTGPRGSSKTMADSLYQNFGPTLTQLFFGPFHELYTAGLWTRVAPQDNYKSPVDTALAIHGAFERTPAVGYNSNFLYPEQGLDALSHRMADQCEIHFDKRAVQVDTRAKKVLFEDGSAISYERLVSTLPLNKMLELSGIDPGEEADPYTSVLVLNVGALRGAKCPLDHWIYLPSTRAGFHRVGFYDNVDPSFLPGSSRGKKDRVSIYVERAYPGGMKPVHGDIQAYADSVVRELKDWQFIGNAEVVDPTWIEVAYTWSWPDSNWRFRALKQLQENDVFMTGRYAKWSFQGIADSIRDGLYVGTTLRGFLAELSPAPEAYRVSV